MYKGPELYHIWLTNTPFTWLDNRDLQIELQVQDLESRSLIFEFQSSDISQALTFHVFFMVLGREGKYV